MINATAGQGVRNSSPAKVYDQLQNISSALKQGTISSEDARTASANLLGAPAKETGTTLTPRRTLIVKSNYPDSSDALNGDYNFKLDGSIYHPEFEVKLDNRSPIFRIEDNIPSGTYTLTVRGQMFVPEEEIKFPVELPDKATKQITVKKVQTSCKVNLLTYSFSVKDSTSSIIISITPVVKKGSPVSKMFSKSEIDGKNFDVQLKLASDDLLQKVIDVAIQIGLNSEFKWEKKTTYEEKYQLSLEYDIISKSLLNVETVDK